MWSRRYDWGAAPTLRRNDDRRVSCRTDSPVALEPELNRRYEGSLTYGDDPATTNWYGVNGESDKVDSSWLSCTNGAGQESDEHVCGTRKSCWRTEPS